MTENTKKIRMIVDKGLGPALRDAGFHRHGADFSRRQGDALHVVDFQLNKWNTKESGKFTINVGAHFSSVAALLYGKDPMPENPKESRCLLRVRVGLLMPARKDHWWTVTHETDIAELASELGTVVPQYILPWLEQFDEVADTNWNLRYGILQHSWAEAAANIVLGNRTKATQLVENELDRISKEPIIDQSVDTKRKEQCMVELRKWAAAQGLILVDRKEWMETR